MQLISRRKVIPFVAKHKREVMFMENQTTSMIHNQGFQIETTTTTTDTKEASVFMFSFKLTKASLSSLYLLF